MTDANEKLSAPERWALFAARSTSTQLAPTVVFLSVALLLLIRGMDAQIAAFLALSGFLQWERIGFTRLLRRRNRPAIFEQTLM